MEPIPGVDRRAQVTGEPTHVTHDDYLNEHPRDWAGAYRAFAATFAPGPALGAHGFLTPPASQVWYADREDRNAEPLVRDDIPIITAEFVDETSLAGSPCEFRFAYGSASMVVFRDIVTRLATIRGASSDLIEGVGHAVYFHPEAAAAYVLDHTRA